MTTQRLATPASLSPADRARWIAWAHARIARLDGLIARATWTGRGRYESLRSRRERIAHNLATYEAEATR